MNKQFLARTVLKFAVGALVSTAIGYAIKGEKALGVRIDEYFEAKTVSTTN